MSEETTQTPAPSGDSQDSKKQTVRISLPPKPAAAPTIKIPVPPKTAKPGVGVAKRAAAKAAAPPVEKKAPEAEKPAEAAAEVAAAPVEAKAETGKKKKAKVRKASTSDGTLEQAFAAISALGAIGLAVFLAKLGGLLG